MRVKFLSLVTFFVFSINVYAQLNHPFFYELKKDGKTSYLLGTFHIGVSARELPAEVVERINGAKIILPESDFSLEDLNALFNDTSAAFPKGSDEGRNKLSQATIHRLVGRGIPQAVAETMADDACFGLIFSHHYFPKVSALDFEIQRQAYIDRKVVMPLDTDNIRKAAQQAQEMHDAQNPQNQDNGACSVTAIVNSLSDQQIDKIVDSKIAEYRSGKEADNEDISDDDLFDQYRTKAWIPEIIQRSQNGNALVLVGIGHLLGAKGVIRLLKDQGYQIERYPFP